MKAYLFIIFTLLASNVIAQSVLTGKVVGEDKQTVPFANIILLTEKDSIFVAGEITNKEGEFSIEFKDIVSQYLLKVSCVGYQTFYGKVKSGNIGTIILRADAKALEEVVVKGSLPRTMLRNNALVTNVAGTALSKAGTAINVLEQVPGIIKKENMLDVLGKGTPEIYINGHKVRDNAELDRLSSDNIKDVEVLRNPGSRYGASVKAVVRIITKKMLVDGFGFDTRLQTLYNKKWMLIEQHDMNYRKKKLDIFCSLYYNNYYSWKNFNFTQDTYLAKHRNQQATSSYDGRTHNLTVSTGINYAIDSNNSTGFNYKYIRVPKSNTYGVTETDLKEEDSFDEHSFVDSHLKKNQIWHQANLYYNGQIFNWKIDFNSDVLWRKEDNNELNIENVIDAKNVKSERNVTTNSFIKNALYATKLILSHSFLCGNLSIGGEYSFARRHNIFDNIEGILDSNNNRIKESSSSLFLEYSRQFGSLSTNIGIRYENICFHYSENEPHMESQSKKYDNVFPSLSFSMPIGKSQLSLSYSTGIQRPSYSDLSNSVTYLNRYTYQGGNPHLLPSFNHDISLSAVYKWLYLNADFQHIKNPYFNSCETYSLKDETVALISMKNVKPYNKLTLMANISPTIGSWSPQMTLLYGKQWLKLESPEGTDSSEAPQCYLVFNNNIQLPKNLLITAGWIWHNSFNTENVKFLNSSGYFNFSLYKGFLNDRLSFLFEANDIFKTDKSNLLINFGKLRTMSQYNQANGRSLGLTIRYKFNATKVNYKGTGAGKSQMNRM